MSSHVEKRIEARKVSIRLEDGSIIRGNINLLAELPQEEGTLYNRISDLFTKGKEPFIVVFDCIIEGEEGKVLIVSKNKILWISPLD